MSILVIRSAQLNAPAVPTPTSLGHLKIRGLNEKDLEIAAANPELHLTAEFARAAKGRGDLACGAFIGDQLIAYCWRSERSAPETNGFWIRISPPHCYAYKALTLPAFRGHGLMAAITTRLDAEYLQRGLSSRVSFVNSSNYASLRAGDKAGYETIGRILLLRWSQRYCHIRTKAVRKIGLDIYRPSSTDHTS